MKRLWIALSVLVMVWGFSGVSLWHLTRAANQMEATLEQISEAIDKQDAAKLKELTAQFQLEWHHHELIYHIWESEIPSLKNIF